MDIFKNAAILEEVSVYKKEVEQKVIQKIREKRNVLDEEIDRLLSRNLREITLKTIGFDNRWGGDKLEVDHCNGRAGESSLGKAISAHAFKAAEDMVTELLKKRKVLLAESVLDATEKYYKEELARAVKKIMLSRVQKNAEAIAEELLKKL